MAQDLTHYQESVDQFFDNLPPTQFETVDCLFCGPAQKVLLFKKKTMEVYRCRCDFVWNGRPPTQEALNQFYKESQAMTQWAEIKRTEDQRQRDKFEKAIDLIRKRQFTSVLDVGCGTGKFLSLLKKECPFIQELGIDTNQAALSLAKVNVRLGTIDDVTDTYDVVTLWGVLEHLKDPIRYLEKVIEKISPGGMLLVCVPNVESAVVLHLWEKCFTFTPQHLWYFSKKNIRHIFERFGLDVSMYTIEPEELPVVKSVCGFADPYQHLPFWSSRLKEKRSNLKNVIIQEDAGYKIIATADV